MTKKSSSWLPTSNTRKGGGPSWMTVDKGNHSLLISHLSHRKVSIAAMLSEVPRLLMKSRRSPELGTGSGWELDGTACTQETYPKSIKIRVERDVG